MLLLIQEIKVKWTKYSRGAPHAARRNAIPSCVPIPAIDPDSLDRTARTIIHHQSFYNEANDFEPLQSIHVKILDPPNRHIKFGCLTPVWKTDLVEIVFTYSFYCGGAPDRSAPPKTVLSLAPDDWGQIIYNGRFSRGYSGDWYYQQFVYNITVVEDPSDLDPALFSTIPPTKLYKNLANLR